ncbi:MAG: hypothetical protein K9H61_13950 [Bacteroidia bacterium]|nr:hypothetical protein [Bacteroidia bacterium]MCF8427484.1 hypothetical protein [Bacteroidia bacterium]MCF8448089.1 hypothetical protein [Bacteroidia bacterium]
MRGNKQFELSNPASANLRTSTSIRVSINLGNVLTVVSDRKIEIDESYSFQNAGGQKYSNGAYTADVAGDFNQLNAADGIISSYVAEVISATDYYAFGAPMPERSWQGSEYRFGFNGKENDDEINGAIIDYGMRSYDSRIGRFIKVDPLVMTFPFWSPFHFAGNSPILNEDLDGQEPIVNALTRFAVWVQANQMAMTGFAWGMVLDEEFPGPADDIGRLAKAGIRNLDDVVSTSKKVVDKYDLIKFTYIDLPYNLDKIVPKPKPFFNSVSGEWVTYHAHHIFPQHFREKFADLGYNVDNPIFARWWMQEKFNPTSHCSKAKDYNRYIEGFLEQVKNKTVLLKKEGASSDAIQDAINKDLVFCISLQTKITVLEPTLIH